MVTFLNRSHPVVTVGAVILGYITGFFGLIFGLGSGGALVELADIYSGSLLGVEVASRFFLPLGLGLGAFGTANSKKIGHLVLTVSASLVVASSVLILLFLFVLGGFNLGVIVPIFRTLRDLVFPTALLFAALHKQTMEHRKIWFE